MTKSMLSISVAGLISTAAYVSLSLVPGSGPPVPLTHFFLALGIATAAWAWVYWTLRCDAGAGVANWIVLWGLAYRLAGFFGQPLYEDDYFRYLWDGRATALGENPYRDPPARSFGGDSVGETFEQILDGINYPEIPSIYGPTCQWAFRAAYHVAPGKLWPLKLIFLVADVTAMGLLLPMLERKQDILIYAWCPLLIKEVAFTAHVEILGVALAVGALTLTRARQPALAAVTLGLAAGAKVFAVLLVPFLLLRQRPKYWLAFAATVAVLYSPFVGSGATEVKGLSAMARYWEFNSFGYALLSALINPAVARIAGLGLFAVVYCFWLWRYYQEDNSTIPRGDWIFAAFFFFSPVVNPWYLIWMVPFITLRPSLWGTTALTTVMLSYVTGQNLQSATLEAFNHPGWVRPLEFLPVIAALGFEHVKKAAFLKQAGSL